MSRSLLTVHLSLLATAILWGGNFTAIKHMLDLLEPLDVLIIRVAGAALFFALILVVTRHSNHPIARKDLARFLFLGVLGITVVNSTFVFGQDMIPAALASLVVTSNPIYTAVIAHFLGIDVLTPRRIAGIALAMAGFLIVLFLGSGNGVDLGGGQLKGVLLVAVGPLSWAFYTVLSKPLLRIYSPIETAAYTTIGGALGLLPLVFVDDGFVGRMGDLNAGGWLTGLYLSALGVVLAYILWYRGLQVLSASQTAVYIYLVPVFGMLCAWLLLDETITRYLVLGAAVILMGVILTNTTSGNRPANDSSARSRSA